VASCREQAAHAAHSVAHVCLWVRKCHACRARSMVRWKRKSSWAQSGRQVHVNAQPSQNILPEKDRPPSPPASGACGKPPRARLKMEQGLAAPAWLPPRRSPQGSTYAGVCGCYRPAPATSAGQNAAAAIRAVFTTARTASDPCYRYTEESTAGSSTRRAAPQRHAHATCARLRRPICRQKAPARGKEGGEAAGSR